MSTAGFERRVTLGFKILSGYYSNGITKIDLENLPQLANPPWGSLDFENLVNGAMSSLSSFDHFKLVKSWNTSIVALTSDAVAIDFLLRVTKDWELRDRPRSGGSLNAFRKNAVVLLDRLFLEYVRGDWGSASDHTIREHMEEFTSAPINLEPYPKPIWQGLIQEIVETGTILGRPYTKNVDRRVTALLYYRNVVRQFLGPDSPSISIHVDHVIPQTLYEPETNEMLKRTENHIGNLALLPGPENLDKSGRRLREVESVVTRQKIERYEDIPEERFGEFSEVAAAPVLIAFRGELLKHDLIDQRDRCVRDPAGYQYQPPDREE
jgi:hypothetical protein